MWDFQKKKCIPLRMNKLKYSLISILILLLLKSNTNLEAYRSRKTKVNLTRG